MKRELKKLGVERDDKFLSEIDRFLQQVNYVGYLSHKIMDKFIRMQEDVLKARLVKAKVEGAIKKILATRRQRRRDRFVFESVPPFSFAV